jgi:hypothetical protein
VSFLRVVVSVSILGSALGCASDAPTVTESIPRHHFTTAVVTSGYVALDLVLDHPTVVSAEVKRMPYEKYKVEFGSRCLAVQTLDIVPAIQMGRAGQPNPQTDKLISLGSIQPCSPRA